MNIQDRLDNLRHEIWRRLGVFPQRVDLDPRRLSEQRVGNAILEKIDYQVEAGERINAYVGRPSEGAGPWPGIVALHSHGSNYPVGKGEIFLTCPPDPGRIFYGWGYELVERGYVVIAPDQLCFEERMGRAGLAGDAYEHFETLARLAQGSSYMAKCAFDSMRAVDVLRARSDVDASRIGAMGHSGGGSQSYVLGLCDPRVSAIVASCGLTAVNTAVRTGRLLACCDLIPGITDLGDVAAAVATIAPRAALIAAGSEDRIFPTDGVLNTGARGRQAYEQLGCRERIELYIFEGPHLFSEALRRRYYEWLDRFLKHEPIPLQDIWYRADDIVALRREPSLRIVTPYRQEEKPLVSRSLRNLHAEDMRIEDVRLTIDPIIPYNNKRPELEPFDQPSDHVRGTRHMVLETDYLELTLAHGPAAAAKRPAALVLHRSVAPFAVGRDEPMGFAGEPSLAVGPELVGKGFLAAAMDLVGHGTRRSRICERQWPQMPAWQITVPALQFLAAGTSLLDRTLYDIRRAIDYLASRDDVDAARIMVMGQQVGGLLALLAAAADDRIAAVVCAGGVTTAKAAIESRADLNAWIYHPDLLVQGDVPARVARMRPRPLFMAVYAEDQICPPAGAAAVIDALSKNFRNAGAERFLHVSYKPGALTDNPMQIAELTDCFPTA